MISRGRVLRAPLVMAVVLCLAALAATAATATGPLAEAPSAVGLGAGRHGPYQWTARAERPAARASSRRPCLIVNTLWRTGRFDLHRSESRGCVERDARLTPGAAPLIVSGTQFGPGSKVRMTAVAMVFAPPISSAEVSFCDGTRRSITLRSVGTAEASDAGLGRFRYAAFSVHGTWCAARISGVDASGRVLWDSESEPE